MMKKQRKQPQMAFCIKINKQKSINANKTKNQHGCEKHNSHKYTKHTHIHIQRSRKKNLLTQTATAAINAASGRLLGVSKVSHIFLSLTFSFILNIFFFRFCICCINCQWNYRIYAGETAHSLVRSLRLSRYGQIVAQSVVKQGKLQS